jgi:hypothetical protein
MNDILYTVSLTRVGSLRALAPVFPLHICVPLLHTHSLTHSLTGLQELDGHILYQCILISRVNKKEWMIFFTLFPLLLFVRLGEPCFFLSSSPCIYTMFYTPGLKAAGSSETPVRIFQATWRLIFTVTAMRVSSHLNIIICQKNHVIKEEGLDWVYWCSLNTLDMYFGGAWFQSQQNTSNPNWNVWWFFLHPSGKCQGSATIKPCLHPSNSFPIHHMWTSLLFDSL